VTTLTYLFRRVIPATFDLLPIPMRSVPATAQLLAIALQESEAKARRQGGGGPARSFWQFELGGVRGVCTHPATRPHLEPALRTLCYPFDWSTPQKTTATIKALHLAMTDNDTLAGVFARLNLWWLPDPLPESDNPDEGWRQYLRAWNPGKPHPETWPANFGGAWQLVNQEFS